MTQGKGKGKSKGKFRYQGQILPDCHRYDFLGLAKTNIADLAGRYVTCCR